MTSYIQLLDKIEDFCDAHLQIQRFASDFDEQRPNEETEGQAFPFVYVAPGVSTPNYDTNEFQLRIRCLDIIQKDRDNINTIVSDCHLILTDLFAYFSQGDDYDVDIVGSTQIAPLNNQDLDYTAGWEMTVTFVTDGYCVDAIPMNPITPGDPACEDATYTITDTDTNTLYSGSIESGGSLNQIIQDVTVRNSNASYTTTVLAEGGLTLPDITVTDSDGSTSSFPSVQDVVCTPASPTTNFRPYKTGQTVSYVDYDDGWFEIGQGTSFTDLGELNVYGANNNRFTDRLGGQAYADNIYIDHSTNDPINEQILGYYYTGSDLGTANLEDACANGNAHTVGTFTTGWFLPNKDMINTLLDVGSQPKLNYAPFNNSSSISFWTSTTPLRNTAAAYIAATSQGYIFTEFTATSTRNVYFYARWFTYTELGV